jgi:heme/copper-type cytochrome/quinol oxidase subunit 3
MIPVKSTALQDIGYDEATSTLVCVFVGGKTYEYAEVSPEEFAALESAERDLASSVGKAFQALRATHAGKHVATHKKG